MLHKLQDEPASPFKGRKLEITVYEGRSDPRKAATTQSRARSINLALSNRGIQAMRDVSSAMADRLLSQALPMKGRMIHTSSGEQQSQEYSLKGECINSIDRALLNAQLLDEIDQLDGITLKFDSKLTSIDFDKGTLVVRSVGRKEETVSFDTIIGADGSFSKVRSEMMRVVRMDFRQSYIPHGYLELSMPSSPKGDFLLDHQHLHIWPRHDFMLIALPNADKSFTCTLFAPFATLDTLIESTKISRWFKEQFPDALPLIGEEEVLRCFRDHPRSPLISTSCHPYHYESKGIVLGDASHSMVPFYGQGMNCGFEDVRVLRHLLLDASTSSQSTKLEDLLQSAFDSYSRQRLASLEAIQRLATNNYVEMRSKVISPTYLIRKRLDGILERVLGETRWTSLYNMVTFRWEINYEEAERREARQHRIIERALSVSVLRQPSHRLTDLHVHGDGKMRRNEPLEPGPSRAAPVDFEMAERVGDAHLPQAVALSGSTLPSMPPATATAPVDSRSITWQDDRSTYRRNLEARAVTDPLRSPGMLSPRFRGSPFGISTPSPIWRPHGRNRTPNKSQSSGSAAAMPNDDIQLRDMPQQSLVGAKSIDAMASLPDTFEEDEESDIEVGLGMEDFLGPPALDLPDPVNANPELRARRKERKRAQSMAQRQADKLVGRSVGSRLRHATRRRRGSSGSSESSGDVSDLSDAAKTPMAARRRPSHASLAERSRRRSRRPSVSSASVASSNVTSRSSISWPDWRFWRSGSSTTGSSSTSNDADSTRSGKSRAASWSPPEPEYTLTIPRLAQQRAGLTNIPLPHLAFDPLSSSSSPDYAAKLGATAPPCFDTSTSVTLDHALTRLAGFWQQRDQEDAIGGDLGAQAGDEPVPEQTKGQRRQRQTNSGAMAWWLDILCPSSADIRQLRKILPLHPLTIEDILQQEPREKLEVFERLGYYLVVFRALDETYFRYSDLADSDDEASDDGKQSISDDATMDNADARMREKASILTGNAQPKVTGKTIKGRGRIDIVEGVGGKEGVEGVSVGGVNFYMVVFADGILSFHFEHLHKHTQRVQERIQLHGATQHITSHWIAYGLMDSIVDAFFPLIDFIEHESDEIDGFLADPITKAQQAYAPKGAYLEFWNDGKIRSISSRPSGELVVRRAENAYRLFFMPIGSIPDVLAARIPMRYLEYTTRTVKYIVPADADGTPQISKRQLWAFWPLSWMLGRKQIRKSKAVKQQYSSMFDQTAMLRRMTDARKIVTGLARLLSTKREVVRGLRRKVNEARLLLALQHYTGPDLAIYLGDLQDHVASMSQSLRFYDAILSHGHPAYLGTLRITLEETHVRQSYMIARLSVVGLTVIPCNIVTGIFSENILTPRNGDRDHVIEYDSAGNPLKYGGYTWFGWAILILIGMTLAVWYLIYRLFRTARDARVKRLLLAEQRHEAHMQSLVG
ncbi:uncharacterized protein L969DRAFT_97288 [Mixia osmundae IAM 14324]|uniref:Kynurenine 3-monooxygenase n=1 Tax=Mixia osmundae (strain CBS 9802 / IAM 14324 / JCM 22182 / KY 12970) TaxID=764103 RepID=G7EB67_MIXOS|nr:uncharacterized protein L969DRAFT_97288 [Mixia osmundae IAM 14324]KEI36555.1 hypothetical protein L969DRAFT_97288 [Mixia osmundae IAM 14324]GAB00078.1 hypothetical protein E5Q_06780 [Mixia osmundae IAM 14324]